jgi:hypothetical protein
MYRSYVYIHAMYCLKLIYENLQLLIAMQDPEVIYILVGRGPGARSGAKPPSKTIFNEGTRETTRPRKLCFTQNALNSSELKAILGLTGLYRGRR